MGLPRPRAEFWMELARHEERMLGNLDDLDELLLGPHAGNVQAPLLELAQIVVVDLVAMTVPLHDDALSVEPGGGAALPEDDRIVSEPHRPSLRLHGALLGKEIDDLVRRSSVEFA